GIESLAQEAQVVLLEEARRRGIGWVEMADQMDVPPETLRKRVRRGRGSGPTQPGTPISGPGVTVNEAAAHLGIGQGAVYGRIKRGTLDALKVGREWRVIDEDLLRDIGRTRRPRK